MARYIGICPWGYDSVDGQVDSNFKICKKEIINPLYKTHITKILVYNKDTKEDVFRLTLHRELEYFENVRFDGEFLYYKSLVKYNYGKQYEGEFKNRDFHGKGTFIYENGDKYVGDWKDNRRYGDGTMIYKNGDTYKGDWVNDKRHGQGKMVFYPRETNSYAVTYEGDWKDNGLSFGKIVFTNGVTYQGNFINNQFDGFGTIIYPNGNKYAGEWKNNQLISRFDEPPITYLKADTYMSKLKSVTKKGTRSRRTRSRRVHQKTR
jgi:hypothetical protein